MYKYQIAPMMGWTDRYFRRFMREIGGDAYLLFSEMVTVQAIHYGDHHQYLAKCQKEGDVVLQLGGSCPDLLRESILKAEQYEYFGYNLNVGCPSDRVQKGKIGAILMNEPKVVSSLLQVMQDHTDRPVTIKTRVGIDGVDSYGFFKSFVEQVLESGCKEWIIHARDAWLKGLSPRQNRSIPPLRYEYVYQLKQDFPELHVTLNGGLRSHESIEEALKHVDAVMLGRAAYQDPRLIHQLGSCDVSYEKAILAYILYIEERLDSDPIRRLLAPLVIALTGYKGAKSDRRDLAECKDVMSALDPLQRIKKNLAEIS